MAVMEVGCALALCAGLAGMPAVMANPIPENVSEPTISTYVYAYMNLDSAGEAAKPLIRQARNVVIAQRGWVTEGNRGEIRDQNDNIIEELPQFYDIFPADWEVPAFEETNE